MTIDLRQTCVELAINVIDDEVVDKDAVFELSDKILEYINQDKQMMHSSGAHITDYKFWSLYTAQGVMENVGTKPCHFPDAWFELANQYYEYIQRKS